LGEGDKKKKMWKVRTAKSGRGTGFCVLSQMGGGKNCGTAQKVKGKAYNCPPAVWGRGGPRNVTGENSFRRDCSGIRDQKGGEGFR